MVFIYIIKLLQRSGKRFEKASLFLTRGRLIFSEASLINSQIRSFRAPPLVSQAYLQRSSKRFEKASLFLTRGRVHIATSQFPSASTDIWLITMFTFAFAHLHLCPAFAAECGSLRDYCTTVWAACSALHPDNLVLQISDLT